MAGSILSVNKINNARGYYNYYMTIQFKFIESSDPEHREINIIFLTYCIHIINLLISFQIIHYL